MILGNLAGTHFDLAGVTAITRSLVICLAFHWKYGYIRCRYEEIEQATIIAISWMTFGLRRPRFVAGKDARCYTMACSAVLDSQGDSALGDCGCPS